ncbi:cardiolipin synthase [Acidovorax sp. Be4]|uniref:Cardiolipin synthase n=1 Tax=Acidovorax bellezanensis TaxID=2976702 RepID=A0ABT2PNJ3_9BURK|nr:cardiolipin synthase [Acidovorax sp. Be4]MCT9812023.1 cardiolipin synthase [Acidovorax sp. Be4]
MDWISTYWNRDNAVLILSLVWSVYVVVVGTWILMQRRAPVATLSWLLSMAAIPVGGLAIYYFLGPQRLKRQRIKRLRSRKTSRVRTSAARLRDRIPAAPDRLHQVARLVSRTADFPVSSAERMDLLVGGASTYDSILEAVRQARHHVHLEYYIFEPDQTGSALMQALVERAQAGVKVRMLVDSLGSKKLTRKFYGPLVDAGGEFAFFHPTKIGRRLRPVINFRTHRKILVCDGRVAFTGGVNITDEEDKRVMASAYHDVHLRLEGPVVNWLQTVFLEDWAYALERQHQAEPPGLDELLPDMAEGAYAVQVMSSGPDNRLAAIHRTYVAAINAASDRVWLTTPYFVPTEAAMAALTNAALRGVDVQLLVPEKSDSFIVTAAARSYFDELIACGARVHEYHARMLHSKTLVVDDNIAIIGTANFDNRSFFLNYEVCAIAYGPKLNGDLVQQFKQDLHNARQVPYGRKQRFFPRLVDSVARLCSPLL